MKDECADVHYECQLFCVFEIFHKKILGEKQSMRKYYERSHGILKFIRKEQVF